MTFDVVRHSETLARLVESQLPFAMVTLIGIRGSAPQVPGARVLVTGHGLEAGTIGGGRIEAAVLQHAQRQLQTDSCPENELLTWNLQTDIGMTCGGEVQLFFEYCVHDSWPLVIFGAGHIAQALIPLLLTLHCRVTCLDFRAEWLERLPHNPKLTTVCADPLAEMVRQQPDHACFLLMTQGHATDLPVLQEILTTRDAPYVGVIGSRQKAGVLKRDLQVAGVDPARIDSFYCPMGLPLGNNTPAEIAISIAAQLLQVRDRSGSVSSMRDV